MSRLFSNFICSIKSHSRFTSNNNLASCLIDASVNDEFLLYGVIKIGIVFSRLHNLTPVAIPYITTFKGNNKQIITSMCERVVRVKWMGAVLSLINIFRTITILLSTKHMSDVLNIQIRGAKIGPYIYDQCYVPLQTKVNLRSKARILYSLTCFYIDEWAVKKSRAQLVIIGDPAHRGSLFEICRANNIKCVNAVNVYQLQMCKYFEAEHFNYHYRQVTKAALSKLPKSEKFNQEINKYFTERFSGSIKTHDVIRAYSPLKKELSKEEICKEHQLDVSKPLVVVMAHCFSDAPHSSPHMLYENYEEWLINSVIALKKNPHIEFVIKEHPSADLYNEKGLAAKLLKASGNENRILKDTVNTKTILNQADVIVTCGGTIGLEAASCGKNVVLAARPPYAGNGFTIESKSVKAYEKVLSEKIHNLTPLSNEQIENAKSAAICIMKLYHNYNESLELGHVQYMWGQDYDKDAFYKNVILENSVPLEQQNLFALLEKFNSSDDLSMFSYEKLNAMIASSNESKVAI